MTISRIGKRANKGGMYFRPSLQDTKRANLAAFEAMAHPNMTEEARKHLESMRASVKPKQIRAKAGSDGRLLESDIQRQIVDYLLNHPKVGLVMRFNSGAVTDGEYYVKFAHIYSKGNQGEKLRMPDLYVLLKSGRTLWIEVKREGWTSPKDAREIEQRNFLRHIVACGGNGIFATSFQDVKNVLGGQ